MLRSLRGLALVLAASLAACGEEAPAEPVAEPAAPTEPEPVPEPVPEPEPGPEAEAEPVPVAEPAGEGALDRYLQSLVRAAGAAVPDATPPPECVAQAGAAPATTARVGRMIDEARLLQIAAAVRAGRPVPEARPRSADPASFLRDEELDRLTAALASGREDAELASRLERDAPYLTILRVATLTRPERGRAGVLDGTLLFVDRVEGRVICTAPVHIEQPAATPEQGDAAALENLQRRALEAIVARLPRG